MPATYLDCITYQRGATGLYLSNLLGNTGRIAACSAGATSLTAIAPLAVALNQYDAFYLFDGPNSEVLQVGPGGAAQGTTTVPLQGPATYAHGGGAAYCTDGVQGSVGQALFEASRWIEDICHQSLWSTVYTGEILTMPTMRAAIDNQYNLHFRPRHFPITAFSSITIQANQQLIATLDPTQAIIDSDQQTVDIPNVNILVTTSPSISSQTYVWQPFERTANAWITLSYTAGYVAGSLPWSVARAATLLTNEMLRLLENPVGADTIVQGKRNVTFALRGDQTGESLLYKQAMNLLSPYIAQSF
jgi:hypothetical protein